jgi:hypothetical protein
MDSVSGEISQWYCLKFLSLIGKQLLLECDCADVPLLDSSVNHWQLLSNYEHDLQLKWYVTCTFVFALN